MSIADKLSRLASAREDIIDALGDQGVAATGHGFEDFPDDIAAIEGGGGGSVVIWDETDSHGGTIRHIESDEVYGVEEGSATPSASQQVINPTSGKYFSKFTVAAMPAGTAGTPTATKGSVSNHSVQVTPSVTNQTGHITGGTKTGTPVTVSASELVSGSETKTQNGTYDVTNLAELVVNVSGGGGKNVQYNLSSASVHTNAYSSTGISITVAKTGTYKVSWTGWRSSSSGTMGTNLYKNGNAGTNQQTWTNTYGQCITLNNQSYNAGDVLTLYANAGSTTRYCWAANLIIEEQ